MFKYENRAKKDGYTLVIGIDEAGRGPLAGPVVAAAVALREHQFQAKVDDSKKLTPQNRLSLCEEIYQKAYVGVGIINESVIDEHNILRATFFAMANAVRQLFERLPEEETSQQQAMLLVDGNRFDTDLKYPYQTITRGDQKEASIMCASVVAKVTRDRILLLYGRVFPQYGFERHKGYATRQHVSALKRFGPSLIHRKSFSY